MGRGEFGRPGFWLKEAPSTLFISPFFIGTAVATRRNDHLYLTAISEAMHGVPRIIVEIIIRLVVLGVAFCLIWYGYQNYLRRLRSFCLPAGTPTPPTFPVIRSSAVLFR